MSSNQRSKRIWRLISNISPSGFTWALWGSEMEFTHHLAAPFQCEGPCIYEVSNIFIFLYLFYAWKSSNLHLFRGSISYFNHRRRLPTRASDFEIGNFLCPFPASTNQRPQCICKCRKASFLSLAGEQHQGIPPEFKKLYGLDRHANSFYLFLAHGIWEGAGSSAVKLPYYKAGTEFLKKADRGNPKRIKRRGGPASPLILWDPQRR